LVPLENAQTFRENLKTLPPEKRINWQRYSVKRGDSLIKIAKQFNTTPMLIKEINHLKSNTIKVKQKLLIPTASKGATYYDLSQDNRLSAKQAQIQAKKDTDKITYTVNSGDTMWDLSREHKVSVRELARWNGMAPTDPIKPGQKIVIWSQKSDQRIAKQAINNIYKKREMIQKVGYYVRKGDSLARIADKFNVTIKDLVSWNKLDRKKYLKPGQKITIFVDITNS
jgi:membrane-bound lytic murein transglycosylase D